MLLYIPLESHKSVLKALSASATYMAKKKLYKEILAKNRLKSLRGASPQARAKVNSEFKRQWKVYVRGLRKNRKQPTTLSDKQQQYRQHFKDMLKKYGATSPASLSKEEKSKFFTEVKSTWLGKKGGSGLTLNKATSGSEDHDFDVSEFESDDDVDDSM